MNNASGNDVASKRPTLTNIQQLRGIAALLVVFAHVVESATKRIYGGNVFIIDGIIGVDIFFVISGFIMVGVTHGAYGQAGSARDFMIRRVARIVPIYWILTSVMAALLVAAGSRPGLLERGGLENLHTEIIGFSA